MSEDSKDVAQEITYVSPLVCYEAVCTCGWQQHHKTEENARKDAENHQQSWHGRTS